MTPLQNTHTPPPITESLCGSSFNFAIQDLQALKLRRCCITPRSLPFERD